MSLSGSLLAIPLNVTSFPSEYAPPLLGVVIVAVGGRLPGSTLITTISCPVSPLGSLTINVRTKSFPGVSMTTKSDILVLRSIGLPKPDNVHMYCKSSPSGSIEAEPSIWNGFPASITDACLGIRIRASGARLVSPFSLSSRHPPKDIMTTVKAAANT